MASTSFSRLAWFRCLCFALAACGEEDPSASPMESSSTSGTTSFGQSTSTAETNASDTADGGSTAISEGTTTGTAECMVEFDSPIRVSNLPFSGAYDLALSGGGQAVVGPEGNGVILAATGPESVQLIEAPPEGRMEVGALQGGERRNDILFLATSGTFSAFTEVDRGPATPYQGSISASVFSALADFNEDGNDDVVLLTNSYDYIEVWDLSLGEQAERIARFQVTAGLPAVGRARRFQAFPALALYTDNQLHGLRLEAGSLSEDFAFEATGIYAIEGLAPGTGEDRRLLVSRFFQQGPTGTNSISISARRAEGQVWQHKRGDLDQDLTVLFSPQAGDLDSDGETDVVIVGRQAGKTLVVGMCSREDELRECGSFQLEDGTLGLLVDSDASGTSLFVAQGDAGLWEVAAEVRCD